LNAKKYNAVVKIEDKIKIIKEYIEEIQKELKEIFEEDTLALEKICSKEKGDSEALKRIKEIAKEESEFYDKHGYYSFWSDALKIQRIKEMEKENELHKKI